MGVIGYWTKLVALFTTVLSAIARDFENQSQTRDDTRTKDHALIDAISLDWTVPTRMMRFS